MKSLLSILITPKSFTKDWRAKVYCFDSNGNTWVLKGYGDNHTQALQSVYDRYMEDEGHWDCYGDMLDEDDDR